MVFDTACIYSCLFFMHNVLWRLKKFFLAALKIYIYISHPFLELQLHLDTPLDIIPQFVILSHNLPRLLLSSLPLSSSLLPIFPFFLPSFVFPLSRNYLKNFYCCIYRFIDYFFCSE